MTISLRPIVMTLPVILAAWLALLAAVMRMSDATPAALVILPSAAFLANLPDNTAITARGPFSITLTSTTPDFVATLYAAGAPLVLPAGLTGCLPQS